jgi:hypothetical protein
MGFPAANFFGNFWKGAGNNWKMKMQLPASVKFGKKWERASFCKIWKKMGTAVSRVIARAVFYKKRNG